MKLVAALLLGVALPTAACPLPPTAMQQGGTQASWQVDGEPIKVGRHFAVIVQVCPADATLARVDATMPEHKHGMNYKPSVRRLPDGRWRAEGLMFHMPGRWDLMLEVQASSRTEKLVDIIRLP